MGSFNLKIHQNSFLPGLRPRPRWGSLRRSPRPSSLLGRGTPPFPSPLDAFGISILGASLLDAFSVSILAKPASTKDLNKYIFLYKVFGFNPLALAFLF